MQKQITDESFETEQKARQYAADMSKAENVNVYIILTGDQYFVSLSKKVQPYETLVDTILKQPW